MPKINIPEETFTYPFDSAEWLLAHREFRAEYDREEYKLARAKALQNAYPNEIEILRLINAIELTASSMEEKINTLKELGEQQSITDKEAKLAQLLPEEINRSKNNIRHYESRLGKVIASAIIQGDDLSLEIKKIQDVRQNTSKKLNHLFELPRPDQDNAKQDLKGRMLIALDELRSEWFPNQFFNRWMISKSALRKKVFSIDPSSHDTKRFQRALKELGLSKLPEAKRGRKKK